MGQKSLQIGFGRVFALFCLPQASFVVIFPVYESCPRCPPRCRLWVVWKEVKRKDEISFGM